MRSMLFAVLLSLSGPTWAQSPTDSFCYAAKRGVGEVQSQLPMQMDAATQWIGASVLYVGGVCRVSHDYLINSDAIIAMAQKGLKSGGIDSSRSELTDYYTSQKGVAELKATMRSMAEQNFAEALKVPNVEVRINYGFSDPIEPFTITLTSD